MGNGVIGGQGEGYYSSGCAGLRQSTLHLYTFTNNLPSAQGSLAPLLIFIT
jgi:hypothetical protein